MHGGPSRCPLGGGSANPKLTTFQRRYISRRLLYRLPLILFPASRFSVRLPLRIMVGRSVEDLVSIPPIHCMPSRVRDVGVLGEGIGSLPARGDYC